MKLLKCNTLLSIATLICFMPISAQSIQDTLFNNKSNFENTIAAQPNSLVYFYADWCISCKLMNASIYQINKKYSKQIKVIKINIDKNKDWVSMLEIPAIPALHYYQAGKIKWAFLGYISQKKIIKQLNF